MSNPVIIGSRGSDLALWQARFFRSELASIGVESEIKVITTKGDRIQHLSFDKIEGKGFFTKEIEDALLSKEIDVAIHSHKDLETQNPPGLVIAGVSDRENPADLLLVHPDAVDLSQPFGFKQSAVVGTSSARRKGQIFALRPDISIKDIRGNVPTRINKLRSGGFDAILLAAAGVQRLELDLSDLHVEELDTRVFIPAPAQGVLAYQCRETDHDLIATIGRLHKAHTAGATRIERTILSGFGGGCHIPIGVHAIPNGETFDVRVNFASAWESFPNRVRFVAHNVEEAKAKFAALREKPAPQRVFISRSLDTNSFFKRGCAASGFTCIDQPLIRISNTPFTWPQEVDWVFFASSNAVRSFFEQHPSAAQLNTRWAAIGGSTASVIHAFTSRVDFIAAAGSTDQIAKAFASLVGKETVFFPQSSISRRTIQEELHPKQCLEAVAYQTDLAPEVMPEKAFDAYVLTSPSNVEALVKSAHSIPENARLIAIGQTTADVFRQHGYEPLTADVPHEAELFSWLAS